MKPSNPTRPPDERPAAAPADLTGRAHLVRNVLGSWGAHLVFLVAGFVLPRMIDGHVGQQALGVWDFGWSIVAYFVLALGGIVSSVNRFVARYRAAGDLPALNRFVSSVSFVLLLAGLVLAGVTGVVAWAVPRLLSEQLAEYVDEARWVVGFLGLSVVVQVTFAGFAGVLTGCHRWDLHNGINAGAYALTVVGMIIALLLGGGLRELALLTLLGEVLGRTLRCLLAYRVCPGLSVRLRHVRRATIRESLTFGGKSYLPQLGDVLLNQTIAVLIVVHLGPAALAAYSRPRSLVRHVNTLVQKLAMVLTPTASSFDSAARREELRDLLVKSTRYAAFVTLPMILTLVILGGPLLRLWMGPRYENGLLLATLALGYCTAMLLRPAQHILVGLNAHGRPGAANLAAAAVAIGLAFLAVGPLNLGLLGAALAAGIPLTLANGLYIPFIACRVLHLPTRRFVVDTLRLPLLCVLPYALCLLAARLAFTQQPPLALGSGILAGGLVLAGFYWHHALPPSLKKSVTARFRPKRTNPVPESAR